MTSNLISEDELRAALRPCRVDPDAFESGIRERLKSSSVQPNSLASRTAALRIAAAVLPLELFTSGRMAGAAVKLAPATAAGKLLGYVAFPAISLFVLLGATIFSVAKIRRLRDENRPGLQDEEARRVCTKQWWNDHKWGAGLVFAATLVLSFIGATWLLFLGYIVSLGVVLYILKSFGKSGLGNRELIGKSCSTGLVFLAQIAGMAGIGDQDIHLLDQGLIVPVFLLGVVTLMLVAGRSTDGSVPGVDKPGARARQIAAFVFVLFVVGISSWYLSPILRPATPARIKAYVESFDEAPYSSSSWQQWEIVASWAVDSKLNPEFSAPRQLLAEELAGEQNPFVLGSAFRVGLVQSDQLRLLREYESRRHALLDDPTHVKETQILPFLELEEWVIRASVLHNDLTSEQRDYLAKRLHATLATISTDPRVVLKMPLRATQLLAAIERPVDPDLYRDGIHDVLRKLHSKEGGGFALAGGFKEVNVPALRVGSLEATSCAVQLMEVYGIPDDLDFDWVRSFLKPLSMRFAPYEWMAAVTLDRLNHLPGATKPTWLEAMYYERSLLAAMVLVGLCLYATLSSPKPESIRTEQAEGKPSG